MREPHRIRLLVSDVDGTLLDAHKQLAPSTRDAVKELGQAGIQFVIVSHRPLQGLKRLMEQLNLRCMCAALNGGIVADQQFSVLAEKQMPPAVVQEVIRVISDHQLDPWVYTRDEWYVPCLTGPHVQSDAENQDTTPLGFERPDQIQAPAIKVSAIGDNYSAIEECEAVLRSHFGAQLSISRQLGNHLDISHPDANKGTAVTVIAGMLKIPLQEVAAAGDGENDISMFRVVSRSIAMGQASPEVHRAATDTTVSNSHDGLAWAIRHIILGQPGS